MTDQKKSPLPTDPFSLRLWDLKHNPGAISASSTIDVADDYGNADTYVVQTWRTDGGSDTVFLQLNTSGQPYRIVLPAAVMAALARHRDQLSSRNRSRASRRTVANRRALGLPVGNPDALRTARTTPRKRRSRRRKTR